MKKSWRKPKSRLAKVAIMTIKILRTFIQVVALVFAFVALVSIVVATIIALAFWTIYSLGQFGLQLLFVTGIVGMFASLAAISDVIAITATICYVAGLAIMNLAINAWGHEPICIIAYLVYILFVTALAIG